MAHQEASEHLGQSREGRLRLIRSPLAGESAPAADVSSLLQQEPGGADLEAREYNDKPSYDDSPEFQKHEEATNIELFFDLFFAANLTVFSEVHELTNTERLTSYIGYFCVLWFAWATVGLFDVRFVTDSIFERIARAGHLAVMIGFAVVGPLFDPSHQITKTFRTFSLILMVSRLILTAQYLSILWHVRRYRNTTIPFGIVAGLHFVAAMIYLGITFRFQDGNSRVYVTWYVVGACEILIHIGLSGFWRVLSFKRTHLINRMSLLTLIIIGEGIIVVCNNVSTIVTNPDAWSSATIGVVTSGVATIYLVYQIYFDWMRNLYLPPMRQLFWAALHFPVHLALTLFMEGASGFMVWWKISEAILHIDSKSTELFDAHDADTNLTTSVVVGLWKQTIQDIFEQYEPIYQTTLDDIDHVLHDISQTPDSLWPAIATTNPDELPEAYYTYYDSTQELVATIGNSLFASFKIDNIKEALDEAKQANATIADSAEWEIEAFYAGQDRFKLVLAYAFVSAGLVLILLNFLFIASRTKKWTVFNIFRAVINFLFGIGLCLISLILKNQKATFNFQFSPWALPTICLVYFVILILNHLPHPSTSMFRRTKGTVRRGARGRYAEGSGLLFVSSQKPTVTAERVQPQYAGYHNGYGSESLVYGNGNGNGFVEQRGHGGQFQTQTQDGYGGQFLTHPYEGQGQLSPPPALQVTHAQ